MTPERWQKVKEIFQAAVERVPQERSAFLSSAGFDGRRLSAALAARR